MKIKKVELVETMKEVEISANQLASNIYEDNYYPGISLDELSLSVESELDDNDEYSCLSDEDKNQIFEIIDRLYNKSLEDEKEEELKQLCDRSHIISTISDLIEHYDPYDIGDIGFSLSAEEILDEILKNGNK